MDSIDPSLFASVVAAITTVTTIVVATLKGRKYVEDRVKEALEREEVVRRVAQRVKPDLIFNQEGSVIVDRGAGVFVENKGIEVTLDSSPRMSPYKVPEQIRIAFKSNLRVAPLLTSLNPETVTIRPRRGVGHDWIFEFRYSMTTDDEQELIRQYRLEILEA